VEVTSIPLLFEPLRLLLKKVPFSVTILIFILSILFGLLTQSYFLKENIYLFPEEIALLLSLGIVGIFAIFSYYPPKIFLFKDPITGRYGDVKEH
ncbi:MAG TPA: DUF6512 family protein, partial [Candidatus Dojkabacteria bacterium]|nr:DUF6512 family protein [Candidatus Dojkabacteria bacterium]